MTQAIAPTATPVTTPPSCSLRSEDDSKERSLPSENVGGEGVVLAVAKNKTFVRNVVRLSLKDECESDE